MLVAHLSEQEGAGADQPQGHSPCDLGGPVCGERPHCVRPARYLGRRAASPTSRPRSGPPGIARTFRRWQSLGLCRPRPPGGRPTSLIRSPVKITAWLATLAAPRPGLSAALRHCRGRKTVCPAQVALYALDVHPYAPLNVTVTTPRIELRGATDDLLEELVPLVRAGQADADPPPFDDPMSLYESDPDTRVEKCCKRSGEVADASPLTSGD